ncbi:septation protein IspZ [Sulfurivermis fontis]|uniref:septation protein IspZ n=1 Tax=Sulfurivermis fontis TaxID=1972068 RepID=UPI001558D16F|nr:septation protein IspZ [Sulfurivermis fontis]
MLLLITYPVTVHYGVLTAAYIPAVVVLAAIAGLQAGNRTDGFRILPALLAMTLVLSVALLLADNKYILLLWPPLLIYFGLAALFAVSLLPGRQPLVTRIATLLDGALDEAALRYTRRVTLVWALFLTVLGLISIVLACCGTREAWSLYTNLLGYLLILAFFAVEFLWRRRCLPQLPRRSFTAFMAALVRLDPGSWRR